MIRSTPRTTLFPNTTPFRSNVGNYTAKVIIERGAAPPAEQRTAISATQPVDTLTAQLRSNDPSGKAQLLTKLTATPGVAATGTINYTFWWNCADAGTSVGGV